tara:strand:+ start:1559 stop:1954 length:396 start_codon:yes stop_codon:yes gene_type:complete
MAHFAVLDENNVVTAVNVIGDDDCKDGDGNESEAVGITFCTSLWGAGTYKQTSYNNNKRKQYATVGGTYDASADQFVDAKPYPSWTLDSDNDWQPPYARPADHATEQRMWRWDESAYQADNSTGWVYTVMS